MQQFSLTDWVQSQAPEIEKALRDLVEINTYTANTTGVDTGMDAVTKLAESHGFTVETVNARHRLIKGGNGTGKPRIMLVSHMDTVFPPDGDFLHFKKDDEGFVYGPGVGDIKGGLLIGLWAMIGLRHLTEDFDVQMIVSADEEKGSPTLRDWYRGGHIGADYAIGLEPGFPQGKLTPEVDLGVVYQRRGYGAYLFTIHGVASHSGTPWLGLDAVEAAARRILDLKALNDWDNGMSVTIGMVNGGISPNTVAGEVTGSVSWRFERLEDGERLRDEIEAILKKPYLTHPQTGEPETVTYELDAFLPPMERSEQNQYLTDIVIEESDALGYNNVPIARGGGSDCNFISSSGTPSICGMGAPVHGIHTTEEMIYFPGMLDRVALLTRTLYRLVTD